MSFRQRITLDDTHAATAFAALVELGADLRSEVFAPIGVALEATTMERFDSGTGPDGEAWVPSLRVQVQGGKTLVDHGHLRDSIHSIPENNAVEIGSAHISAGIHQFGGVISAKGGALRFRLADGGFATVKSVTIPARPFVGLSSEDGRIVEGIAAGALERAMGGAG